MRAQKMHDLIIIGVGPPPSRRPSMLWASSSISWWFTRIWAARRDTADLRGQSGAGAMPGVEVARVLERAIAAQPEHALCDE